MTDTPEQRAALAALVGITPETHRHLCKSVYNMSDDPKPFGPQFKMQGVYWSIDRTKLPALDTPEGDYVFLAPLMRWCGGDSNSKADMWIEQWASNLTTMELIERCQSARVPEICAIFPPEAIGIERVEK